MPQTRLSSFAATLGLRTHPSVQRCFPLLLEPRSHTLRGNAYLDIKPVRLLASKEVGIPTGTVGTREKLKARW